MAEEKKKQVEEKVEAKKKKPEPVKAYVHVNTFLQTAIPFYGLTRVQAQGFKSRMNGKQYQTDEQVFVKELKAYLNLK